MSKQIRIRANRKDHSGLDILILISNTRYSNIYGCINYSVKLFTVQQVHSGFRFQSYEASAHFLYSLLFYSVILSIFLLNECMENITVTQVE